MAGADDEESAWVRRSESSKLDGRSTTSSAQEEEATEESPLLRPRHNRAKSQDTIRLPKLHTTRSILLILGLVVLLTSFGDQLQESPQTRIFESVICYRYYEEYDPSKILFPRSQVGPGAIGGVEEWWCKNTEIQDDLARIIGYSSFFDGFPFLILAVPFGWAADRWGRWPILFLNLLQFALRAGWTQIVAWNWQIFDLRAVWATAALALFGGGNPVASNLFFVVIADVTPAEDRAAAFLRIGAANLSANLLMPPLAAWLMQVNPWIPFMAGTVMMILAALLFCFIPETMDFQHQLSRTASRRRQTPTAEAIPDPAGLAPAKAPISANLAQRWYLGFQSSLSFLIVDWRVPALISPFLIHLLISNITRLVLQYLGSRYGLTFSQGTLLMTIRNAVLVLLLFIILPWLSTFSIRVWRLCGQRKDLYLARASQSLVSIGWLLVALAPDVATVTISLAIASLSQGSALLIRSLLTSLLPPDRIAVAYSLVSMTDTVGSMFGSPVLAGLFAHGLELGGMWSGLPFLFVALLSAFFAGMLFVVRLRKGEGEIATNGE